MDNSDFNEFLEVSLILGGPMICSFVADNLAEAHIDAVKDWYRKSTMNMISRILRTMEEDRPVPYEKAEDEFKLQL